MSCEKWVGMIINLLDFTFFVYVFLISEPFGNYISDGSVSHISDVFVHKVAHNVKLSSGYHDRIHKLATSKDYD